MEQSIKKKSVKAFSWDLFGRIFTQGNTFIVSIFLARLLGPEQFGLIAMAMAYISIATVFIDIGFSSALIQRQDNTSLTYNSIFVFNILAGFTLTIVTFLTAPLIGDLYDNKEVTNLVRWLSLIFIFNSFNRVQNVILNKNLNFKAVTIRTFVASTISGTLGIIGAYKGMGVYSLVLQTLSFALIGTLLLWSTSSWKPKFQFSYFEVKKLMGYSVFAFFERVLNNIFIRLDVLLLASIFSPTSVGYYTRSSSLVDQVTKYTSSSIIRVLFPVLSKLQNDQKNYERIYFRMFSVISFLSFIVTGILYFMGSDIILVLFGKKWSNSIPIFQILIIASCNLPLNSLMWNAMMSKGKAKENFYYGFAKKLIGIVPFLFAIYYGIWWFTVTWVVSKFIDTFLNFFMLRKHSNLSVKKHIKLFSIGFIPLLPGFILFELLNIKLVAIRISFTVAFILVYIIINWLIKNEGLIYILTILKDLRIVINKSIKLNKTLSETLD